MKKISVFGLLMAVFLVIGIGVYRYTSLNQGVQYDTVSGSSGVVISDPAPSKTSLPDDKIVTSLCKTSDFQRRVEVYWCHGMYLRNVFLPDAPYELYSAEGKLLTRRCGGAYPEQSRKPDPICYNLNCEKVSMCEK